MKKCSKTLFLLSALTAGLGFTLVSRVTAQTFTTLHSFTATPFPGTNSDGANPYGGLLLSGDTLYGTAYSGGSSLYGTLFAIHTDGTGFTNLHNFYTNPSDGANPRAGLILSGNTLYGTTYDGGSNDSGTVFAVHTDGTGYTNLHNFAGYPSEGNELYGGVILSSNTLYGTTYLGGANNNGTVFAVHTDGTGYTNLYSFTTPYINNSVGGVTNSDGWGPIAGLILSSNMLYGTAEVGGTNGNGTVFAINTNSTGYTVLYSFTASLPNDSFGNASNSDGTHPDCSLILSGDILYGTAAGGGTSGWGTVFAVNTYGTGFTNLHSFTAADPVAGTNTDGVHPQAVILSGNTLYGTTAGGGPNGSGTVFAVNTNGTGFRVLYSFTAAFGVPVTNSDGATPLGSLILSGDTLYGTAINGGSSGNGTVFSLSFVPQLTIMLSGTNVILTWPTNMAGFDYSGFTLQSTTNLAPPTVWTNVSPIQVVVNELDTVTNPISGAQTFYRLSQ